MGYTTNLRSQHSELVGLVGAVQKKLPPTINAEQAKGIRADLSKLAGTIMIHLSMEDKVMYPKLLKHTDMTVASMAKKFFDEMEGIKTVFEGYKGKWMAAGAIESQTASFINDTNGLFKALGARIAKEDNELYPVVEKLGI